MPRIGHDGRRPFAPGRPGAVLLDELDDALMDGADSLSPDSGMGATRLHRQPPSQNIVPSAKSSAVSLSCKKARRYASRLFNPVTVATAFYLLAYGRSLFFMIAVYVELKFTPWSGLMGEKHFDHLAIS
jgi:hypothetical protein